MSIFLNLEKKKKNIKKQKEEFLYIDIDNSNFPLKKCEKEEDTENKDGIIIIDIL